MFPTTQFQIARHWLFGGDNNCSDVGLAALVLRVQLAQPGYQCRNLRPNALASLSIATPATPIPPIAYTSARMLSPELECGFLSSCACKHAATTTTTSLMLTRLYDSHLCYSLHACRKIELFREYGDGEAVGQPSRMFNMQARLQTCSRTLEYCRVGIRSVSSVWSRAAKVSTRRQTGVSTVQERVQSAQQRSRRSAEELLRC